MRVAVLDLGSSSFRLAVAEPGGEKGIVPVLAKRVPLNLGFSLGRDGTIGEDRAAAAVRAVRSLRRDAERAGAHHIVTAATSALRETPNRSQIARRLERAAGAPVRFLTGYEEAALTFAAIRWSLATKKKPLLGFDLGGGSLELGMGEGKRPDWVASLPLGAARLLGMFVGHDPMSTGELKRLTAHCERVLRDAVSDLPGHRGMRCYAAGGSVKNLARLLMGGPDPSGQSVDGFVIERDALAGLLKQLSTSSRSERRRMPGMAKVRVDTSPVAAAVISALMPALGSGRVVVSEWGLREGIILEVLGLVKMKPPPMLSIPSLAAQA